MTEIYHSRYYLIKEDNDTNILTYKVIHYCLYLCLCQSHVINLHLGNLSFEIPIVNTYLTPILTLS